MIPWNKTRRQPEQRQKVLPVATPRFLPVVPSMLLPVVPGYHIQQPVPTGRTRPRDLISVRCL